MTYKIIFDERSPNYTIGNRDINLMFLQQQKVYMDDILRARGYVYMNQIYENLGAAWTPEMYSRNWCFAHCIWDSIPLEISELECGDFEISITY